MSFDFIAEEIGNAIGEPFIPTSKRPVGGGSINDAYTLSSTDKTFFIKLNKPSKTEMFEAEAQGLLELAKPDALRIPRAICWGGNASHSYIAMEYIPFGRANTHSHAKLGEQLARLHQQHSSRFGWHRDNTIGSTPQPNKQQADWVTFWKEQRLGYQLTLARQNGYSGQLQNLGEQLLSDLNLFFTDYTPQPSLLHGDLWSGNYGFDLNGNPVIFDPAVYYGDREADIAMTELFGGFTSEFYQAYNQYYPLDSGYKIRKTLYNLYHILNHLNLFGSSYLQQSESMIQRLLSEI